MPNIQAPIKDVSAAVASAKAAMTQLLPLLHVARFAVVVQAPTFTSSQAASVTELRNLLPAVRIPAGATEATYQVIVPTTSQAQVGRELTQLIRWQTVQMQILEFEIGAPVQRSVAGQTACLTYIDVFGSVPEHHTPQSAMDHLEEVVSLAFRLLDDGFDAL